ncbi:hypothetical protein [Roseovarius sp. M141]|uniref:hypothetical protein n=1 Tax=Roseovarius sp. M141 TaxID=2583806 RepID=UPI0020CE08F8|nr:hypothetical protein [Roseovarius sp. M141]MCQ0093418.1 hypothetical protein [Roseovarius sp. M141]
MLSDPIGIPYSVRKPQHENATKEPKKTRLKGPVDEGLEVNVSLMDFCVANHSNEIGIVKSYEKAHRRNPAGFNIYFQGLGRRPIL